MCLNGPSHCKNCYRFNGHNACYEGEDGIKLNRTSARGGVTSIFDMPNNRQSIVTQELLDAKKALARTSMWVNYGLYFGITDENVATAGQIQGHCGHKVFLGSSTGNLLITKWEKTLSACYALRKPTIIYAEDEAQIRANLERMGSASPLDHPRIRTPEVAEAAVLTLTFLRMLSRPYYKGFLGMCFMKML